MSKSASKPEVIKAQIASHEPDVRLIAIADPYTGRAFGVPLETIKNSDVIYAPSGALLRVDHLSSDIRNHVNYRRKAASETPIPMQSAMDISTSLPGYDPDHPVVAVIVDDCHKVEVSVDIGAWLLRLASDRDIRSLMSIASMLLNGDCGCSDDTDKITEWPAISNSYDMQCFYDTINHLGCGYRIEISDTEGGVAWMRKHLPSILLDAAVQSGNTIDFLTTSGQVIALDPEKATIQAIMTEALELLGLDLNQHESLSIYDKTRHQIDELTYAASPERENKRCVRLVPCSVSEADVINTLSSDSDDNLTISLAKKLNVRFHDTADLYIAGIIEMLCAFATQPA
mgnify:CR=1 FL=1